MLTLEGEKTCIAVIQAVDRPVLRDQPFLLPVDMEWLPADHLAWFVPDVVEQLDTSVFRRRTVRAASGASP